MADISENTMPPAQGWRLKLGITLFGLSIAAPVIGVPVITMLGLDTAITATITGIMLVSAEVLGVVAVAVMGKSGYAFIKQRVFGLLRQYGPPSEVSRPRYLLGLVMFSCPIVFGWVAPYASGMIPAYDDNQTAFAIIGDVILLSSLFVLGGDFWDKLRALFFHRARAVYSPASG
ncbi:MAG: transporter suffix domain-containing protein [Thiotrichales bacterium]|nr:MAG: transporter suffix domain-containing protein [Thiotrichales bacterium]